MIDRNVCLVNVTDVEVYTKTNKDVCLLFQKGKETSVQKVPYVKDKIKVNNHHVAVKPSQCLGFFIARIHLGFS